MFAFLGTAHAGCDARLVLLMSHLNFSFAQWFVSKQTAIAMMFAGRNHSLEFPPRVIRQITPVRGNGRGAGPAAVGMTAIAPMSTA